MTASFDSSPRTAYVTDVAAWRGGFVAIGGGYETAYQVAAEIPGLWTSPDGQLWEARPIELAMDDASLIGVAPRSDGRLLMVANVRGSGAASEPSAARSMAWISDDGVNWEPTELSGVGNGPVTSLDHGPRGYVLTAQDNVWFSADGIEWRLSYEGAAGAVAGDEGFVAIRVARDGSLRAVIASADGKEWYESAATSATLVDVAAMGGDWVAVGYSPAPHTLTVWHSANGLDWFQTLDVNDLTGPDGPKTGRGLDELAINGASLAGGAGHAFLTLTNNHCCAQMSWNYGVWGSSDGSSWVPVVEGDAFVSSVATDGQTTIAAGHLRRGEIPAFWVGD